MYGSCMERTAGASQTVWCTPAPDSLVANIEVDDTVITRTTREQGFQSLGWITFDGHFVKESAEREVIAWRVILCDTKIVVQQQSVIATSTAPVVIFRHVITVLVFCQLDSDSVTMHPPARNPRQDVETNDIRTQAPH